MCRYLCAFPDLGRGLVVEATVLVSLHDESQRCTTEKRFGGLAVGRLTEQEEATK